MVPLSVKKLVYKINNKFEIINKYLKFKFKNVISPFCLKYNNIIIIIIFINLTFYKIIIL